MKRAVLVVWALSALSCGPLDVVTVALRVREPADSDLVEDRKLAEIRPVLDGRDLGITQNELTMTFPIESDDEGDAKDHALRFTFSVFDGKNEVTGFGRSNTLRIPTARSVQDGGKAVELVAPVLVAPKNAVTRILSDFPGPRSGAAVCATGTNAAWVFGGTPTGAAGEATSYYFDGQTLDARTAIGTNAMGAPRACGADAGGRVTVLAAADPDATPPVDAGLFQASGRKAPERVCAALDDGALPDGTGAAVVASGDVVFAFGRTQFVAIENGGCTARGYGGGLVLDPPIATAIGGGAAIVGSLTTGWVVVTADATETTGGQEFAGAGPDFLLGVTNEADVVNVLVPEREDGNTTLTNEGAVTIGVRTILGGARGPAGEIVILARGAGDTVVFVDGTPFDLPTARDAVVRTVGGALVLFGGDVEGFDALVFE